MVWLAAIGAANKSKSDGKPKTEITVAWAVFNLSIEKSGATP